MSLQQPQTYSRADLAHIAERAMLERGLVVGLSPEAQAELDSLPQTASAAQPAVRDLRQLLWCSIDNEESRDLDQLSACEPLPDGGLRVWVAIADVEHRVRKDSALDRHARLNTTSVYTAARIFPMLPEELSTDMTSMNPHVDRLAMVTELDFDRSASLLASRIYPAWVHNRAKLDYDNVAAWLDGKSGPPRAVAAVDGMEQQVRAQDAVSGKLRQARFERGALEFRSIQSRTIFSGDQVVGVELQQNNRARQLIEELMLSANGATARFLEGKGRSSLCRVVRSPQRWQKIVDVALDFGERLPAEPDSKALEQFLQKRRVADPMRFPDLSLVVVKLMGAGEYAVQRPGDPPVGHFGLALRAYSHATAPNRRYADLVTQRLLKAAAAGVPAPYSDEELEGIAQRCNEQGSLANKVERQVRKSEAALILQYRIGEVFDGIVTNVADDAVWVRIFHPPVDGRLSGPGQAPHMGQQVKARLTSVDVERGFIDFREVT